MDSHITFLPAKCRAGLDLSVKLPYCWMAWSDAMDPIS